jgi:hypothetical protein
LGSSERLVPDTRKGINLKAKPAIAKGSTEISAEELAWEWETFDGTFGLSAMTQTFNTSKRSVTIPFATPAPDANDKRNMILEAMGIPVAGITKKDVRFDDEIAIGYYA